MRKKDDEKQRNIKKAVIKLILEEGFHGTSMSKIAKEAGVSPATVYIYYQNKDTMLQDIYLEYYEEIYYHLLSKITDNMSGKQLIEMLIRSYYEYIEENKDIFNFVEQFSSCPVLISQCKVMKGKYPIYKLFDDMKEKKVIKNIRNDNLLAFMFSPIKSVYEKRCSLEDEKLKMLDEMIIIIQDALLL